MYYGLDDNIWRPLQIVISHSTAGRRPDEAMTSTSFYYYSGNCSSDVNGVKERFLTAMSSLQLVGAEGEYDVREVKVTCGRPTERRRAKREFVFVYQVIF